MAKTALLAQNDNLAIDAIKSHVGRSGFDLSHSTTFPIDINGAILPICCIETVPGDTFEISCECLLRQLSPMAVPVMTNLKLNTAFYYCDNRLAWKKWDRFIEGGRSGNEVYEIPTMYNAESDNSGTKKPILVDISPDNALASSIGTKKVSLSNSLHTYFNISMNHKLVSWTDDLDDTDELPLAFPFFDYQIICRDNYTDIDRLTAEYSADENDYSNPFSDWTYDRLYPVDDDEIRLKDGPQYKSGYINGDDSILSSPGFVLDKVRYHNVRDDYFTTSKSAPQRGTPPSISLGQISGQLKLNTENVVKPTGNVLQTAMVLGIDSADKVTLGYDNNSTMPTSEAIYNNIKGTLENAFTVSGSSNASITYSELVLLSQLSIWQILNQLHKPLYNDFLNAHFDNVKVGESLVESPQFIGGTSQIIHINEILQTSASTESSPLGNTGATAISIENNYVGKYYCNSYGYIIGVAYILPELLYEPAMPRQFSRRTKEDYYFPEFANLSMQATLNKELFFSNDAEWNNTPWGYTGCYDELRSIPNHIAGELLNPSYTDLKAWTLTRTFSNDNKPSMSTEYLSLYKNVDKTAWSVPNMPAFILQAANYIKAIRPMPYVAIPKAL